LRSQPWLQRHERTWRLRESEGGGFLLDAGASMLDMALRMVPDPTVSEAQTTLRRRSTADVDVEASVRITFSQDVQLEMTLIGDATEDIESIHLFGEKGTAGWEKREETPHALYSRVAGGPTVRGVAADFRVPLPDAQFVAALKSGRRFDDDCDDDLHGAASALPLVSLVESLYRDAEWK
jgi:predicted dehydrogenase